MHRCNNEVNGSLQLLRMGKESIENDKTSISAVAQAKESNG